MTSTPHSTDETIRVLFIENDSAVAEMYKLKLELDGYQVTVIAHDDQVLEGAARVKPDMIFLDLRVEDDRGLATLQQLRATDGTRQVPVIILSNQAASELADRGFKADPLDYVVRAESGPNDLVGTLEVWARAGSG